ncbi:hypothetical protein JTE90_013052 [Oedothorax gibbosus]|uniref:CUB domain-containing protein n=1 Tax=Oedothorax gibbosus TaxID=931172 RepID=A0AAV6TS96_9ARAC|nr:hypothetical protein JTE90_013052 [Oedothorax gibbosus]
MYLVKKSVFDLIALDENPDIAGQTKEENLLFGVTDCSCSFPYLSQFTNYSLADACGGVLDQDRGTITSPNSPSNPDTNFTYCIWDIVAPRKALFKLNFTQFYLKPGIWEICIGENVEIQTKVSLDEDWKSMKQFCGHSLPPTITFEGRQMRIAFFSRYNVSITGFAAEYSFNAVDSVSSPKNKLPITIQPQTTTRTPPTTIPTTIVTRSPREVLNDEVRGLAKTKLFDWFMGLRRKWTQNKKWGHQLPRIAVALFLADQENFQLGNRTMNEMNYELTIQLLSKLQA